jgi:hypothetical protein
MASRRYVPAAARALNLRGASRQRLLIVWPIAARRRRSLSQRGLREKHVVDVVMSYLGK